MAKAISTFGITKRYPKFQGWGEILSWGQLGLPAVDHVDLDVYEGELFGLLGPNGAGKTTLIKMLATLIKPTEGAARVNGFDLKNEAPIKASIGLVTSDERSFYWRLTGRQNLRFFASLHGLSQDKIQKRTREALELVGLEEVADKRFQTFSTGMRQRLSIARALLSQPRLLFLDEPTKGLDPSGIKAIHGLILDEIIKRQGLTVFLTTHYLEEAESLCNRIAIMDKGQIKACGSVEELRQLINLGDRYQIQVSHIKPELQQRLSERFSSIEFLFPDDQNTSFDSMHAEAAKREGNSNRISGNKIVFTTQDKDQSLNQVIDFLRENQVDIMNIINEEPSLMDVFANVVDEDVILETGHTPPQYENSSSDSMQKRDDQNKPWKNLKAHYPGFSPSIAAAFLKRDLFSEVSYRFSFILQFLNIFFTSGVFYFISRLVGETVTPYLQAYGGDYFSFVLIGIAFAGYFGVGLSSFSSRLRQAQTTGTLEAMLTTPTSLSAIVISSSLWDYLLTTLRVGVYLAVGVGLLGMDIGQSNILAALIILILTIIAFSNLGILAASFIMVLKRGDPITWAFSAVSALLGGVYYPVSILPEPLQWLSRLLPITYSLEAMRLALLQGTSIPDLKTELISLTIFSVILLPLSLFSFRYAVGKAKQDGSLTHY